MNWLQFILYITGAYLLYYAALILIDLGKSRGRSRQDPASRELTFSETIQPVKIPAPQPAAEVQEVPEVTKAEAPVKTPDPQQKKEPVILNSGGRTIKEIFELAKQDAIMFIRPVSFS